MKLCEGRNLRQLFTTFSAQWVGWVDIKCARDAPYLRTNLSSKFVVIQLRILWYLPGVLIIH